MRPPHVLRAGRIAALGVHKDFGDATLRGVMERSDVRIGVDLGGTKIEVVALDASGTERFRKRVRSPRGDYPGTIEAVGGLVEDAERAAGPGTVGIGIPGAISPATGLVKNANS